MQATKIIEILQRKIEKCGHDLDVIVDRDQGDGHINSGILDITGPWGKGALVEKEIHIEIER